MGLRTMNRFTRRLGALLLPLAVACACSPAVSGATSNSPAAGQSAAAIHPESGLRVIPLVIKNSRQSHAFTVEVAETRDQQARGLMFRTSMGPDEGMLFPFEEARDASFWMKNTVIPLDIIFIGRDHRILNIEANAVPYSEAQINSLGKAAAVLELIGGRAAQLGLAAGDKVQFHAPKRLAPMPTAE